MKNNLSGLCLRLADGERIAPVAVFHHITPLERRNALRAMEWEKGGTHMTILRWLEGLRTPWLDSLMSAVTELGDETVFMVAGLVILWCVNKRWGFRFLLTGLTGSVVNQLLKAIFLIPRPWVLDPSFTIVESARAGATGYSFPSGHTQNSVGTFGVFAATVKKRWVRIVCVALMILVPFSRMYLGVHTPADVLTAAAIALALVLLVRPVVYSEKRWVFPATLGVMSLCALGFVLYVELAAFPEDMAPENLAEGVKNAYSLLGALLGMIIAYLLDEHKTHFPVKAVWWAQLLKVALGLGLTMAVRLVLKAPLLALTGGHASAHGIRYFIMVLVAGALWPLTFRWFETLGRGKP